MVLTSSMITSACTYVVLSNAMDAQRSAIVAELAAADPAEAEPATALPAPVPFDTTVSVMIDRAPETREAPQMQPVDVAAMFPEADVTPRPNDTDVVNVVEGRPAVVPPYRPDNAAEPQVIAVARYMTPDRLLSLPRPVARPIVTTTPAWPDPETGPQTSPLLAAISPRPALRPDDLTVRVAADPEILDIEVARAEAPEALGGVGESPRGGLFAGGGNGTCSARLAREIPRRPGNAAGGAAVMASVGNGSGSGRDNALVQQALNGNIPGFLRDLHPVTFDGNVNGRSVTVTICVTPDYLAIGSDADHVRVPLGLPAAMRVAAEFDMMLPTTTMVDAIYRQADVRVAPSPMTPGASMTTTSYFVRHDETVDAQFARAGARPGMLVAGHKKDLVIANRLGRNPSSVAIYGWHRTNGRAIQPLSTVHGGSYADYSHGIRLVSRTAFVNGEAVDLRDLLTDERYAGFLNSDGALSGATIRLASL
ncbi:hypothetical protein [Hasllibacter sp. MH4015]|uniref:hypothetical protein n=1 Tax=Hasllibacter sp. MH4015 TaxID=2854029 RepID=UPI001CD75407|nr:hypothetical protein [Hasllibacter sp. MH4015]